MAKLTKREALAEALERILNRIDCYGQSLAEAVDAVHPDYSAIVTRAELMAYAPIHYNRTANYRAVCDGYLREVSAAELTTLRLHEVTCPACQELLETEFSTDDDVCTSCGAIGPWYGAPEAQCPNCFQKR